MRIRESFLLAGGLVAALAVVILWPRDNPAQAPKKATGQDKERQADRQAIEQASRAFMKAFARGDAKGVASFWTANGEYHSGSGISFRGRSAIEEGFAEFFKHQQPGTKIEVLIDDIRFPAPDLAVEEGLLRQSGAGKELPITTMYSVIHVRDKGQWKIAMAREWGSGQDRLEDLDWLVGKWQARLKDQEVSLSFARDETKPYLLGQFTKKTKGKVIASGTLKIGLDPQRGQLRSWHFDDDGGHGQALWLRDGNNWVLDSIGVLGDGTETASVNILGRVNASEVTWRSIDRVMGERELPDTVPIKLSRVAGSK
ncbi:MAG: SgcJ/EcaC family oxidoreductase [Gemmataceae bacterium]|nr:SgcJ/EcaC family oxidoreductase [Gemmataceae bacterium]